MDRKIKILVLQTELKIDRLKEEYADLVTKIKVLGLELQEKTDNKFRLKSDIDENILEIKDYISNSEVVKELDRQKITYTLDRLKIYLLDYQNRYHVDLSKLNKAIQLYSYLDNVRTLENQIKLKRISGLSNIIDRNILIENDEEIYNYGSKLVKKITSKSKEELEQNKLIAFKYLEEKHNKTDIDDVTYQISKGLLNDLFESYDSNLKINNEDIKQK